MAEQIAREEWDTDISSLRTTNRIPFLGEHGCKVAPHFRPLCTMHTCDISGFGVKRNDPCWTKVYFRLRGKYEVEDFKRQELRR